MQPGAENNKTDLILKKAQRENQGKLTIFLGAAAGVGKTCAMLKDAHAKLQEGVDVVVGFAMSHGRRETEKLMDGLPALPQKKIVYNGAEMEEMDVDAILQRRPQLVIIDELAHTNVPGSRFRYRYSDVDEILKAGIDVYTAVNIQHIESLNDVVAQITGTVVKETVPDEFINRADDLQLIDIPPTELQKRLQEGKIYAPEQAARALKSFFRQGNISALRELALRFTAARVDVDTTEYMRMHDIEGPWPSSGKVMVCASYSPFAAQLIRSGHRLAHGLHSELLIVNVETPNRRFPVGDKERERIWKNFKLTKDLGGKVITVFGEDVVETLLQTARENNVNAIIIGKSGPRRFKEYFTRTLVDRLIEKSGSIPVYVIKAEAEKDKNTVVSTVARKLGPAVKLQEFIYSALMVTLITMLMLAVNEHMELVNIALMYLVPVLVSAMWWGRIASYYTTVLSILAFEYYFIVPTHTFMIEDIRYLWSFVIFFAVSFAVGKRTEKLRSEIILTSNREQAVNRLYQFSKEITALDNKEEIVRAFASHVGSNLRRRVIMFLPENDTLRTAVAYDPETNFVENNYHVAEEEVTVALWSFEKKQIAGRSTDTLPTARYLFMPIMGNAEALGVVAVDLDSDKLSLEERGLLEAWIGLLGMMLYKAALAEKAHQAELLQKSDTLRAALFNSVSHELKTPLAGIMGAVYTLQDKRVNCSEEVYRQLIGTISESGRRMERIITNLLDTARIESGMVKLKIDWCDMEDVVSGALRKWGGEAKQYNIVCDLSDDLPLFKADCGLLEHVVLNFVDNAAKYAAPGTDIQIKAAASKDTITLMVIDNGCGFTDEDRPNLFKKFYRAKCTDKFRGSGLGLSICKSIIDAHGGKVWAQHREDKQGSIFGFDLPVMPSEDQEVKNGN